MALTRHDHHDAWRYSRLITTSSDDVQYRGLRHETTSIDENSGRGGMKVHP